MALLMLGERANTELWGSILLKISTFQLRSNLLRIQILKSFKSLLEENTLLSWILKERLSYVGITKQGNLV
jgi:hypothetical protein